eukprot:CAMPEP_0181199828 /NCGR_PEP_ID=MMETSP1096-20121128/17400_1 /TAXON_ID=156174 ORGANISM="Chrysochromulina ericina, Strain CCMP281" /NCGR_SAMPLE_ID=MMETSP1096 /ASSEMBLY_ACC=CAM_ASM_000453 /LENGTH=63 /DNA_ID=CAMNT_0023290067 /DNA_START=114 /DNA_END=301 /DNA_ORIENTATION=+
MELTVAHVGGTLASPTRRKSWEPSSEPSIQRTEASSLSQGRETGVIAWAAWEDPGRIGGFMGG